MKKQNKHIGSSFDDFLKENNLLDECEASAVKRVLAWQFEQAMQEMKISKTELARRMHTSRAGIEKNIKIILVINLKNIKSNLRITYHEI